jgi:hypothetical protein
VKDFGAFDLVVKLPDNANLGTASLTLNAINKNSDNKDYTIASTVHHFELQEFRRPEFKAEAKMHTVDPHIIQGHAILRAEGTSFMMYM